MAETGNDNTSGFRALVIIILIILSAILIWIALQPKINQILGK